MTFQPHVLEMRLGQTHAQARRWLAARRVPAGAASDDTSTPPGSAGAPEFTQSLDTLGADLLRLLRGFDDVERQRFDTEARLAVAPHGQRWSEQSRMAAFDRDLSRIHRKAALLAAALIEVRGIGASVSGVDVALAVHRIGLEVGRSLDQALVRHTVQQVRTRPAFVPAMGQGTAAGRGVQSLFVVVAMVAGLARLRQASAA